MLRRTFLAGILLTLPFAVEMCIRDRPDTWIYCGDVPLECGRRPTSACGDKEREAWARLPFDGNPLFERLWARPTFEVHGIRGGFTGEGCRRSGGSRTYSRSTTCRER